jgi:LemA protein
MAIGTFVFLGLVTGLVLYIVLIYNNLVRLKHNVARAWSNIDVLLKQRHEEIPKLVDTCRQYMTFEKDILERVTQARASVAKAREAGDVTALGGAETQLRAGLAGLYAVAENYPELRTSEHFQHLQTRISQLEAQIADRREFYNDSVNVNNMRIEQVPDAFIARAFHFGPRKLLEFDAQDLKDVNVKALFTG